MFLFGAFEMDAISLPVSGCVCDDVGRIYDYIKMRGIFDKSAKTSIAKKLYLDRAFHANHHFAGFF